MCDELKGQAKLDYDPAGLVCNDENPAPIAVVPDSDGTVGSTHAAAAVKNL